MKSQKSKSFLILLTFIWSFPSNAIDIKSHLSGVPDIFSGRSLAIIEGDREELVTKPEEISEETINEDQISINEAADKVLEQTLGGVAVAETKVQVEEKENTIVCEQENEAISLTEEVETQHLAIMKQMMSYMETLTTTLPKLMNLLMAQNFKAPQVNTGYTGIAAQNTNHAAGIGLNLLSLSDFYNTRSLDQGGTVINNYNVSGDFYHGAYNGGGAINAPKMFSPMMEPITPPAPFGFDFNAGAVRNHSRFDQMNDQNMMSTMPFPSTLNFI